MGEWVWTSVVVGGKATREVWEKLAEMCPDERQEDIDWCANLRCPFWSEGTVNNADTEDVREFCRAHGLTYRVNDQGLHGELPCQLSWRPGMKHEHGCFTDCEYNPYITLRELEEATAAGYTMAQVIRHLSAGEFEVPPIEIADGAHSQSAAIA